MKINFDFSIGDKVFIKDLNIMGVIVGLYYGDTGAQYQVSYIYDGIVRTGYMYKHFLSTEFAKNLMGFSTK